MDRQKFRRALRAAARLPGQLIALRSPGSNLFSPEPNELPLVLLRIQVLGCTFPIASKDRASFVTVSLLGTTHHTPVVRRSVNPTYEAKDATWDFPLYLSLADRLGAVELVIWDKRMVGKDYVGEVAISVHDLWAGGGEKERRPFGWDDPGNRPFTLDLETTRDGAVAVPGTLRLKLGFVKPPQPESTLGFEDIYKELLKRSRPSVISAPPTEGIGTIRSHQFKAGAYVLNDDLEDRSTSSSGSSSSLNELLAPESLPHPSPPSPSAASPSAGEPRPPSFVNKLFSLVSSPPPSNASAPKPRQREHRQQAKKDSERPTQPPMTTSTTTTTTASSASSRSRSSASPACPSDPTVRPRPPSQATLAYSNSPPHPASVLNTGWDMDPFVVVSFGKRVFRTRVLRHTLDPVFEEKMMFRVRRYEAGYQVRIVLADWERVRFNERVGEAGVEVRDLMESAPEPDAETGVYELDLDLDLEFGDERDGTDELERDMREYAVPLAPSGHLSFAEGAPWDPDCPPVVYIRAKYTPYALLRHRFFAALLLTFDTDSSRTISRTEFEAVLDVLGATVGGETVQAVFARYGGGEGKDKDGDKDGELRVGEAVRGLEWVLERGRGRGERRSGFADGDGDGIELERVVTITTCPMCHRRLGAKTKEKEKEEDVVMHLAVCASRDWARVDRLMMADADDGFVTASEALRKGWVRVVERIAGGSYRVGANSANIVVQDRATGEMLEERMQVYVRLGIRLLYKGMLSEMEGPRARRLLRFLSVWQGIKYDAPESKADIPAFVRFYAIHTSEMMHPLESFNTFNEFFYRKLKPGARPLDHPTDPHRLVSAADCRLVCFPSVCDATRVWIKGREFSVARLLGRGGACEGEGKREDKDKEKDKDQDKDREWGALAVFRLAPQDYHRFHAPVEGRVVSVREIEGEYYTVNPQAVRSALDVFGENVRTIVDLDSPHFGRVVLACVGAMMVGSVRMTVREGEYVVRGQEMGYFAFGGSTVVALFEKEAGVRWDEDLLVNGRACLETLVRVGMGIGRDLWEESRRLGGFFVPLCFSSFGSDTLCRLFDTHIRRHANFTRVWLEDVR
ncbi:putative catalyzes the formation of phosphatidylethanolamine (PtdEtn) from phosphatidylserine (PtdSer) [Lyophyllum shimeji]|uniref:phosphatidylserine decarboxylase n=1 Tax=Lyophyllum shimeji TaxID=47721 RepID=A0A9P3UMT1_LYOSH|nr:putative catalyzes the formation of phosphatidylethanolamine (PtdEtn) from phosphatidylserine (PtdSer) [Lyophyllum shimeji]